jgi:hypothetical protein
VARLNFGLAKQRVVVDRYCQLQDTACMKVIPDTVLSEHQKKQNLISIQREDIDENELHGFILDFNKEWLLMVKEYDFIFDGFMMVKREFVSAIKHGNTQKFHKRLFQIEGKMVEVDFGKTIPEARDGESSITQFVRSLAADKVVMLEDERDDFFLIGFIEESDTDSCIGLRFFDGEGQLEEEVSDISHDELTILTFDSSYCLHYERYFRRMNKNQQG